MKLSELKFKVITGTPGRNRIIIQELINKGQIGLQVSDYDDAKFIVYNARIDGKCVPWIATGSSIESFVMLIEAPEVTFQQALDLIRQVEEPEPEFPFKPKDWCMATDPGAPYGWKLAIYSNIADCAFQCIGSYYKRIAPLDEKMLGVVGNPAEWWEIKDGKPKLMRR